MTPVNEIDDGDMWRLIISEIVRYCAMILPLYLSGWRYAHFKGHTEFIPDTNCTFVDGQTGVVSAECMGQYWGIVTAIIVGGTLVIYIPLKFLFAKTVLKDARYIYGWYVQPFNRIGDFQYI